MSYSHVYRVKDHHRFDQHTIYEAHENYTTTAIAYVVLFALGAYSIIHRLDWYASLSLSELFWNFIVYITPYSLIIALDKQKDKENMVSSSVAGTQTASSRFAEKSEALRRILKLDAIGSFNVQRPRSLSGLGSVFSTQPSTNLPGLGNWDNSCYQNSILQGLASLPSLLAFLDQARDSLNKTQEEWFTHEALSGLIEALNSPKNVGRRMWTPPVLKSMSSWQQQDAQEYYSKVVDQLEKEIARTITAKAKQTGLAIKPLSESLVDDDGYELEELKAENKEETNVEVESLPKENNTTPVRNPLEGFLAQRVGCLNCGFVEGLSLIPFNCLTLPLGRGFSYDIRFGLDQYTALEPISGVECANCTLLRQKGLLERLLQSNIEKGDGGDVVVDPHLEAQAKDRLNAIQQALNDTDFSETTLTEKCHIPSRSRVSTTKSRQAVIARAPQALVLHVNRSIFDELTGMQSKNYASVRFPKLLDLAPWCLGSTSTLEPETWSTNPAESMLRQAVPGSGSAYPDSDKVYSLRAIITHYGRHENGHYIAYRQTPAAHSIVETSNDEGEWWRMSDDDVAKVSEENVFLQGGVFMLFYERATAEEVAMANARLKQLEATAEAKQSIEPPSRESTSADDGSFVLVGSEDPPVGLPPPDPLTASPQPTSLVHNVSDPKAANQNPGKPAEPSPKLSTQASPSPSGRSLGNNVDVNPKVVSLDLKGGDPKSFGSNEGLESGKTNGVAIEKLAVGNANGQAAEGAAPKSKRQRQRERQRQKKLQAKHEEEADHPA